MDWFYVINDRRHGPVSAAQLEELHRTREIHDDTFVWHAGMKDWEPLHQVTARQAAAAHRQICSECQNYFPTTDMICVQRNWVCAACKPGFLQKLSEGAVPQLGAGQFWRQADLLVFNSHTAFPDRCIHCNAPANGYRLKHQVFWAPTFRIVLSHQRAELAVGLCPRHRQRHFLGIILVAAGAIGGGVLLALASGFRGFYGFLGIFAFVFVVLVGKGVSPSLTAARMENGVIWLRGAGKAFLADLPQWTDGK